METLETSDRAWVGALVNKHLICLLTDGIELGCDVWPEVSDGPFEIFVKEDGSVERITHEIFKNGNLSSAIDPLSRGDRDPLLAVLRCLASYRRAQAWRGNLGRAFIWRTKPELNEDEFTGEWNIYFRLGYVPEKAATKIHHDDPRNPRDTV